MSSQELGSSSLTGREPTVGATEVDVAFWDGSDAQLVVGTGEEGSKSAGEHNVPLTGSTSHGNTDLQKKNTVFIYELYMLNLKGTISKVTNLWHKPQKGAVS